MAERRRLIETTWSATHLCEETGDLVEAVSPSPTIQFDPDQASGSTGVNRWSGGYSHVAADLCFGQVAMTMMAGPETLMDQEQAFLDVLNRSDSYAVAGETLEVREGDEIIALFEAIPSTIDGDWRLEALDNGRGAVVAPIEGTSITARVQDGAIAGSSGCNRYRATCHADKPHIRLGPAMGTRMICDEPDGVMEQEEQFLSMFARAHAFEIVDGTELIIFDDDGSRLMQFRRTE